MQWNEEDKDGPTTKRVWAKINQVDFADANPNNNVASDDVLLNGLPTFLPTLKRALPQQPLLIRRTHRGLLLAQRYGLVDRLKHLVFNRCGRSGNCGLEFRDEQTQLLEQLDNIMT